MKWADVTIIESLTQVRDAYANQGGSPSGDAAVTDVALGKTFDSATAGAGATGTSTKNATVAADAPLQPPQVYVDNALAFANTDGFNLSLNNSGVTGYNSTQGAVTKWLAAIASNVNGQGADIDLIGNALDLASIDALLAEIHDYTKNGGVAIWGGSGININGGTNAVPLLPVFTIDFNNLNIATDNDYGTVGKLGNIMVHATSNDALAASSIGAWDGTDTFLNIGISDSPSKQQIITKLVAIGGGKITDLGGLMISVAPGNHSLGPLDFTGMTGSGFTQGNNNVANVQADGWIMSTN